MLGVNSRNELAEAEAIFQNKCRRRAMENGATLTAPETVYFSVDTKIGRDVEIGPFVVFGPGVVIEDNVVIKGFCHFEGAHLAAHGLRRLESELTKVSGRDTAATTHDPIENLPRSIPDAAARSASR